MAAAARPPGLRDAEGTRRSKERVGPDAVDRTYDRQIDATNQLERSGQVGRLRRRDRVAEDVPSQAWATIIVVIGRRVDMAFGIVASMGVDIAAQLVMKVHETAQCDRGPRHAADRSHRLRHRYQHALKRERRDRQEHSCSGEPGKPLAVTVLHLSTVRRICSRFQGKWLTLWTRQPSRPPRIRAGVFGRVSRGVLTSYYASGIGVASTLSMRRPSRSTISKRQP